jgi:prefoldin alpha subunit
MSANPAETADQRVQEELYRLEAYRSQLNALLQQHQMLTASRSEHLRAREGLEGLDRTSPGTELLVPLGADAFLRATAVPNTSVLVGIGSGVVVEMERPKASEVVAQRLVRLEEAAKELEGQIRSLDERIQLISQRLDAMSQDREGSGGVPSEHVGGN